MKRLFPILISLLACVLAATSTVVRAQPAHKGEVLVLLSGAATLPLRDGKTLPTGYYLNEFGVPADALQRAGYRLTVVTPGGRRPRADRRSVEPRYFGGDTAEMRRIEGVTAALTAPARVRSLDQVLRAGLDRYAGLFIPGGHAPLVDLAGNPEVGALLRHFHSRGKPTAAICHGPAALLAAQDDPRAYQGALDAGRPAAAANWIYQGYRMTVFADIEERAFEESLGGAQLRYYPAQAMGQAGGAMGFAPAWQPHVVVDRELITGQNPFSDHALAAALVAALERR